MSRQSDLVLTGYRTDALLVQPAAMTQSRTRHPASRIYRPAVAAGHAGMWLIWPRTATLITVVDVGLLVVVLTVIATALYAPDHISDRAFHLLPWTAGSPASDSRAAE